MGKYICPYCFKEHLFSEIEFRCVNINPSACPEEKDEQYRRYLGMDEGTVIMKKRTFPPRKTPKGPMRNKYMAVYESCPNCGMKSTVRVCPSCHNELPEGIENNKNMIIAIVGSRDAGKTHFISVLVDELQNRICPRLFRGTFNPMNDDMQKHYEDNFYNKVFLDKALHDLTSSGNVAGESSVRKPLIYEMVVPVDKKGKRHQKITFVFYDAAGEDLKNETVMRTVNKYICMASGIIFLLDPMQIRALRFHMEEDELKSSSSIREDEIEPQEMVLRRIVSLIRSDKGMAGDEKISIPTAVAFSKFDVLKRLFPGDATVLEPSAYLQEGTLDENERFTVSKEIEAMLRMYGADGFIRNVDINFSRYTYCTLSALGQQPVLTSEAKTLKGLPMPHRIEDPFLWILKENGFIEENKGSRENKPFLMR